MGFISWRLGFGCLAILSDKHQRHGLSADPILRIKLRARSQDRASAVLGRLGKTLATMIKPLFGAQDEEWVTMTGRYILNMGALEMATRLLIARITGGDSDPIFADDLSARIGFIRKRFPRDDIARHAWGMNVFAVAVKHTSFRNIVAHSPLAISGEPDGTYKIQGIMDVTPKSKDTIAQLVSLEELKGRVNESAATARGLLEMQVDFPEKAHGG